MKGKKIRNGAERCWNFIYKRIHTLITNLRKADKCNGKFIFLSLFVSSFLVFGHSLTFDFFIFDDYIHIFGNHNFDKSNIAQLSKHLERPFIPLTYVVWGTISYFLDKDNAFYFHFLNLIFHLLNSFLVFVWIREVFRIFNLSVDMKKITIASFVGAMIFLLHPQKVESVVWASGFKDILSFNLGIIAFILFLRSKDNLTRLSCSLALVTLGGLAKPHVVILFVVFLLFDILFLKINKKRFSVYAGTFFIISCFLFIYYKKSLMFNGILVMPSFFGTIAMAARATTFYLSKIFFPFPLAFDYGLNFFLLESHVKIYLSVFLILALFTLAGWMIIKKKKLNVFSFSIILYFILLFPVLGFMPFIFQNISTVADRFTYLPSLAFSFLVASSYIYFFSKTDKMKSVIALYISVLACLSVLQVFKWRESETFLAYSFNINNQSYPVAMALGTIAEGKREWHQALDYYSKANKIKPDDFHSYGKIIRIHELLGVKENVLISLYRQKIDSFLNTPPLIFKLLIEIYLKKGDKKNAIKYFEKLKRKNPDTKLIKELQSMIK